MADGHKDYSTTPLWRKLGIREGSRVRLLNAPDGFEDALVAIAPLPNAVDFLRRSAKGIDVAVLFTTERQVLERRFGALAAAMEPDGRLWVAWPKKASRVATDLTFEIVQSHGLAGGMVDNKSAAIDEVFQGLQFVYRVQDRPGR
ncbi:MAG: DUF3052 domain-containing protein [Actinomycetota bacterium]